MKEILPGMFMIDDTDKTKAKWAGGCKNCGAMNVLVLDGALYAYADVNNIVPHVCNLGDQRL